MTWIIDTGTYLDASKKCQQLASDINLALGPLHRNLVSDCAGMAGDHEKSLAWTTGYDQHARDIVTLTAALCNALQRFGDFLAAAGYNWWHSDSTRATGAAPPRPTTSEPFYDSGMQLPASAKGDNGAGIDTSITGLMEQVGRIPNGDLTKLGVAKDAWKTFASNSSITGAAERINGINAKFSGSSDPLVVDIEEKLTTLRNAAQLVADAAAGLAVPVADHHEALGTMRDEINAAVASAGKEIAAAIVITAAVVGVVAFLSVGTAAVPAAAGGAVVTAEIVASTATIIRSTVSISRLLVLFGAVTAAGSAAGVFTGIPDLTERGISSALAAIAAIEIRTTEQTVATSFEDLPAAPENPAPGLTDASEEYVLGKHIKDAENYDPTKGTWTDESVDLDALADAAAASPARGPNDQGNFEREVDAGHVVGSVSEKYGGNATSRYKVVTDRYGSVVTMYPIP